MLIAESEAFAGANKIVHICAGIQPHEKVLVLTDTETVKIGELITLASLAVAKDTVLMVMTPRQKHGQEPPDHVAAAMRDSDVILMPQKYSMTHALATKEARRRGARVLSMGDYTESLLKQGGIEADFLGLEKVAKEVAAVFTKGSKVHVTSPGGTDLWLDITGRHGFSEPGFAHAAGSFASPPNIEANVGPLEGKTQGTLVVDASVSHPALGLISQPIQITIENGYASRIDGGKQAELLGDILEKFDDPAVYNIAELGIGLNPCSVVSGSMLEDEGAYGTSHIGIGDSSDFEGIVQAKTHLDLIMFSSTIVIDGKMIQDNGTLTFIEV
jgi:leucyl aminopeptidase (aminopeptidase T)